jgi:hypothetical protein
VCVAGFERQATTDRFVVSLKERTSFMTDATIPTDDLKRQLVIIDPDDPNVLHLGLVGDTYTVLLSEKDTAGLYCLIDMNVPPGGGPPPIATTLRKRLFFSKVSLMPLSEERSALCELGKRSTSQQMLLINSITLHRSQCGCFASVRLRGKRNSSKRSGL